MSDKLKIEHFVSTEPVDFSIRQTSKKSEGFWLAAWKNLRVNPFFIVSSLLIILLVLVAVFPGLFTKEDPSSCFLQFSNQGAIPGHIFGFDTQGCDIFSRVIYGARASLSVGVLATVFVVILGGIIGAISGFFGGILDATLQRITDIFFAIPLILGAIVVLQMFRDKGTAVTVAFVLGIFGWTQIARITRGAVISAKQSEFVQASTALGASKMQILVKHILPNAMGPVIATATVSLGVFIVSEATLSFLGLGLGPRVISWGADISSAQVSIVSNPSSLLYPSAALAIAVLAFIMLGDALKDALDPKARNK
jgi:oligopeptide transport system permease protein